MAFPFPTSQICESGQILEYRPQPDDPEFAVIIGPCLSWPGCGCQWDLPEQRDGEPPQPASRTARLPYIYAPDLDYHWEPDLPTDAWGQPFPEP